MKLPFLISIPHGGTVIPQEIKNKVILSKKDLFEDGDAFTTKIYSVKDVVISHHETNIARAFVDLNRNPKDQPPKNPDGVVKTTTCYNKTIYSKNWLTNKEIQLLLDKYYYSYHNNLENDLKEKKILFAFDCHSMASEAPTIAPDTQNRPLFCLSNNLDKTSSKDHILVLKDVIADIFKISLDTIWINKPFKGGFITRKFGNKPIPWIQIEMNRSLYLNSLNANKNKTEGNFERINEKIGDLNKKFRAVLINFHKYIG